MPRYRKHGVRVRAKILELTEAGKSWTEFAENSDVPYTTARGWILSGQPIPKRKGGSNNAKKTSNLVVALVEYIEKNSQVTLEQCKSMIQERFQINAAISTIKNWLDCELLTLKNVRPVGREG